MFLIPTQCLFYCHLSLCLCFAFEKYPAAWELKQIDKLIITLLWGSENCSKYITVVENSRTNLKQNWSKTSDSAVVKINNLLDWTVGGNALITACNHHPSHITDLYGRQLDWLNIKPIKSHENCIPVLCHFKIFNCYNSYFISPGVSNILTKPVNAHDGNLFTQNRFC